jgi:hypothetical protein
MKTEVDARELSFTQPVTMAKKQWRKMVPVWLSLIMMLPE